MEMLSLLPTFDHWPGTVALAITAGVVAWLVLRFIVSPIVGRLASRHAVANAMHHAAAPAARVALSLFVVQLVLNFAPDTLPLIGRVRFAAELAMIAAVTWFAIRVVGGVADAVVALHPIEAGDNLHARQIVTQTRVLSRIAVVFVVAIGSALMLMAFPSMRQIGTSLLASAGLAGIVAGFAARSVLSNLFAGLQIALTQPIRLDDVVIIEGEWGRIEEIRGTYVVVKIWDDRRLVVPLQWFIEHPFQNWTRRTSALLGTVELWMDFSVPLKPLRDELERIVKTLPEWDGRVAIIQVTDANARAMLLRVLLSAADAGKAFDLRCKVREALIGFVRENHPHALPRIRAEAGALDTTQTAERRDASSRAESADVASP